MTGPLYRIGGFCSRHHWPVIAAWILAVIALALGASAAGERTSDNLTLPGTGSTEAQDLLKDKLPEQAYGTNPIVLEAESGKLTSSANSKAIDATVVRCLAVPAVMSLFGKAAWWLPRPVDRVLPRISIEGEEYFAERDARTPPPGPAPAKA